jgi:hypothetical protein
MAALVSDFIPECWWRAAVAICVPVLTDAMDAYRVDRQSGVGIG